MIRNHDITLYGGSGTDVVLRPLCRDGDNGRGLFCDRDRAQGSYGATSPQAFCFLMESGGTPVGECRLQLLEPREMRGFDPPGADVRRIDLWMYDNVDREGDIGCCAARMLVGFAFAGDKADVLHGVSESCGIWDRSFWERLGFTAVEERPLPTFRLSRQDYMARKRFRIPKERQFLLPLRDLQPSQLYICDGKLRLVREWFRPAEMNMDPVPLGELDGALVMLDGHTRAAAAFLAGLEAVPVYRDTDDWDREAYRENVRWCREEGIRSPADLAGRVVSYRDYEALWMRRCMG